MRTRRERPAKRQTADERREEVIEAAIGEFAMYGYHGGSTERIAAEAGISQPYVLRLFGTKKALFIAAVERVCDDIIEAWAEALDELRQSVEGLPTPEQRLEVLELSFNRFVHEVVGLRLILQASAAAHDDEIRAQLQQGMDTMFTWVYRGTGASYEVVREFWARGMMLMVAASIGARQASDRATWARAMLMWPDMSYADQMQAFLDDFDALHRSSDV